MLRVVEDDPDNRRLVLRADPWNLVDIARRLVLTALLLACFTGVVLSFAYFPVPLGFAVALFFSCFAWIFRNLVTEQVAEIVLDGASRSLRVRCRGRHIWRTTEIGGPVQDSALLRLRAGLVARHGFRRPELGLDLHDSPHYGGPQRRLAPTFAIEGIDRRDEARALAEAIARRLGLGIAVEYDDALLYQARITVHAPAPPPLTEQAAGYRQLPRAPGLARDALPSFEPPHNPPALDLPAAAAELRLDLVRADTGELVAGPASAPIAWKRWSLLSIKILLACTVFGAGIAWLAREDPVVGAVLGFSIPIFGALWSLLMLAFAMLLIAAVQVLYDLLVGLLASERDLKPRWFNTLPLPRWRLGEGALSGPLRPLVWRRGDVMAVVVVDHWSKQTQRGAPVAWLRHTALCIRARWGWVRLARTPQRADNPENRRPVPPSVIALAIEVARTLDAPLRGSP